MAQNKKMRKSFIFFTRFCWLLCTSFTFLVLVYKEVVFRPLNSGLFDVQTDNVLLAVWQLATLKDTLSKR